MAEYRGFIIDTDDDGKWWATAGGGLLNLGPFDTEREAQRAADEDLGDSRGEVEVF